MIINTRSRTCCSIILSYVHISTENICIHGRSMSGQGSVAGIGFVGSVSRLICWLWQERTELLIKKYEYSGVGRYLLAVDVVYGNYMLPIDLHPFHLSKTVINGWLLLFELEIKAKELHSRGIYQLMTNKISLDPINRDQRIPQWILQNKPNLIVKTNIPPNITMWYGYDLRIDSTHQINPIRSNVHDINFMINELFDIEVNVIGIVCEKLLLG